MSTILDARRGPFVAFMVIALALGGCSTMVPDDKAASPTADPTAPIAADAGDGATWEVVDPTAVTPESTTLELAVTRVDCAGGVTGVVLEPVIEYDDDRVVIRTAVEENGPGAHTCQGNEAVAITVALTEPVGDRVLVDAFCLDDTATTIASCEPDGARWRP